MSELKPPRPKKSKRPESKAELSIVSAAQKSAEAQSQALHEILSSSPVMDAMKEDWARTSKMLEELFSTSAFVGAQNAIIAAQEASRAIAESIAGPSKQLAEFAETVSEPMNRLRDSLIDFNKDHLGISAVDIDMISIAPQNVSSMELKTTAVALKNRIDDVATEVADRVDQKLDDLIDNLTKQGIIGSGIKNARANCKYCSNLAFKIQDMSRFMRGTHKCAKCGKMLQIPADLDIIPDNKVS